MERYVPTTRSGESLPTEDIGREVIPEGKVEDRFVKATIDAFLADETSRNQLDGLQRPIAGGEIVCPEVEGVCGGRETEDNLLIVSTCSRSRSRSRTLSVASSYRVRRKATLDP
jgi:hypothetical protein